ncbi:MAG: hypothetical protein ACNFW9_03420 [Candidatus Kerfeldbacteria bacterium]
MRLNKNHIIFIAIAMAILLLTIGCGKNKEFSNSSKAVSNIQAKDQLKTAENFERLYKAVPPPELQDSQERRQLVKRLNRFNVANKISFIYIIDFGKIIGFFTVKGKVSSVNSMLTCTEQLVDDGFGTGTGENGRDNVHIVPSPDLDGSYGTNGKGVFFFTDLDIYVEWNGTYMLSDQYIKLDQPPVLMLKVKA